VDRKRLVDLIGEEGGIRMRKKERRFPRRWRAIFAPQRKEKERKKYIYSRARETLSSRAGTREATFTYPQGEGSFNLYRGGST